MPLLGVPSQQGLVDFLTQLPARFARPEAIVVISAHWEAPRATISAGTAPALIYDYYGFPPPAYEIQYPAPGHPALARALHEALENAGMDADLDEGRGFDHGMFVPLKLMYPEADIPCIQLSLVRGLDPRLHLQIGKAMAALSQRNILVLGSGMSFHNLRAGANPDDASVASARAFNEWLIETLVSAGSGAEDRANALARWESAPYARHCHPREEHLIPLHVCYGMAMERASEARVDFNETLMNHNVISLRW